MKSIIKTSKTVQQAIEEALNELKIEKDDVEIEILEEPTKGVFGIFGAKDAKVKVIASKEPVYIVKNFLSELLDKMHIDAEVIAKRENNNLHVNIEGKNGKDMGVIIGKRGKTLDSIQYIINLIVNKNREKYVRVLLDTENYRKRREDTLIRLAKKMSSKAKRIGKSIRLEPMNPYERRIIHSALQNENHVCTYSEGEEPYRRVVIDLK